MASRGTVAVKFTGDTKALERSMGDLDGKFSRFGKAVGKAVALAGAAVAAGAVVAGKQLFDLGVTLESVGAKAETVFGESLGTVEDWAKKNAAAMGLGAKAATGLAANFADLLVPMGFTRDQAAEMSTSVVGLSGALASWSGGQKTAAEVSEILAKAMLGERDGLKALGISITEADVKAKLLANGQDKLTGAALEQAKATATQQLILEKSTDAQAAFADSNETTAEKMLKFRGQVENIKERLAMGLLPIVQKVTDWLSAKLIPVVSRIAEDVGPKLAALFRTLSLGVMAFAAAFREGDVTSDGFVGTMERAGNVLRQLMPAFQAIASFIADHWKPMLIAAGVVLAALTAPVGLVIAALIALYLRFEVVRKVVDAVVGFIVGNFQKLAAFAREIFPAVQTLVSNAFEGMRIVVSKVVAVISAAWRLFGDDILKVASSVFGQVQAIVEFAINTIANIIRVTLAVLNGDWGAAWDGIKAIVGGAFDFILDTIRNAGRLISGVAGGMFDGIKEAFRAAINWIIGAWNRLEFRVPGFDPPGPGPTFPGATIGTPNIPRLASGGIVRSPTVALIGEAGPEAVVPLGSGGGLGALHVHIHGTIFGGDKRKVAGELADAIHEALLRKKGANGRLGLT